MRCAGFPHSFRLPVQVIHHLPVAFKGYGFSVLEFGQAGGELSIDSPTLSGRVFAVTNNAPGPENNGSLLRPRLQQVAYFDSHRITDR